MEATDKSDQDYEVAYQEWFTRWRLDSQFRADHPYPPKQSKDLASTSTTTSSTSRGGIEGARTPAITPVVDDDDDVDVGPEDNQRQDVVNRLLAIGFTGIDAFLYDASLEIVEWCLTEVESRMELARRGSARALKNPGGLLRWMAKQRGGGR